VSALRLAGKTAVITGAGRRGGLGAGIATRLAAEGAAIVLSDVGAAIEPSKDDPAYAREIDALAAEIGGTVSTFTCDVRVWDQVQALAAHAVAAHGSLDIWVNNAGIGSIMKPLMTLEPEDWTKVIDVNLTGAFFGLRAAADVMVPQGRGGRIINIASQASKSGFIHAQAYTASKHGLVGLVRSAAIELGPYGITVNNVCPNHVTTGLGAWQNEYFAEVTGHASVESYMAAMRARIPMGRTGLPADIAAAVAFLCSEDAAYITAESMNVSGGEEPH